MAAFGNWSLLIAVLYLVLGPVVGGLAVGVDRKITARMQRRVGPPIVQPFYDVAKLFSKEHATVSTAQDVYIVMYLLFAIFSGATFFAGGNFLLVVLLVTVAELFLILAGYNTRSPFAAEGAHRENMQVMAYEPMTLLVPVGFYLAIGTFDVSQIAVHRGAPAIASLFLIFIGYLFVLTIKLRKSPFDLSTSDHAHQELVKGVTTELSGRSLALYELAHWYELVLFLGWIMLFFVCGTPMSAVVALIAAAVCYFLEIWVDNNSARVKWQTMLKLSWLVALVLGGSNLLYLYIINLL